MDAVHQKLSLGSTNWFSKALTWYIDTLLTIILWVAPKMKHSVRLALKQLNHCFSTNIEKVLVLVYIHSPIWLCVLHKTDTKEKCSEFPYLKHFICLSCSVNSVILQQHPGKAVGLIEKQLSQCFPARAWQHSMVHRCTKCKAEIKSPDKEPDSPNFKSWLFHFLTQWIWESRLKSLNFNFLIGKLR